MKKLLIAMFLALPLLAQADGGTFTVAAGTTNLIVPQVLSGDYQWSYTNSFWRTSTVYAAGDIIRMATNHVAGGFLYTAQNYGTSGVAIASSGPFTVSDNGITWIRNPLTPRTGVIVQRASGGIATIYFAGGGVLVFTADGSTLSLSAPSCYNGAIYAAATGTNTVMNVLTW